MTEPLGGAEVRRLLHDLRTPLTVITGFADLLARDPGALGPDGQRDALLRISEAAAEMRERIDRADSESVR